MTKLYRLKPIAWEEREDGRFARTETAVGNYTVSKNGWSWTGHQQGSLHKGLTSESGSLEEAKAAAQAHRDERILSMLEEVEEAERSMWCSVCNTLDDATCLEDHSDDVEPVAIVKLEDEQ